MKNALRISVTQKCNLKCPYCHNEGQLKTDDEMTLEKIKKIANSAKSAGIEKIKITGGEPLLRKDIVEIIKAFKGVKDVSVVTNGVYLAKYAFKLKKAGLHRINIGCDSLKNKLLKNKKNALKGINACKKAGFSNLKLNMVVLKGINDKEIKEMINFAKKNKVALQLIELINTNDEFYKKHYFSLYDIEKYLESKALLVTVKDMQNRKIYNLGSFVIEVVRPFSNHFCENCKRVRITSDGKIKTCLLKNDNLADFKEENFILETIEGLKND